MRGSGGLGIVWYLNRTRRGLDGYSEIGTLTGTSIKREDTNKLKTEGTQIEKMYRNVQKNEFDKKRTSE